MTLIEKHNKKYDFFRVVTGEAMKVHSKFHGGLLESVYESALTHLPYGMLINFSPDGLYSEWYRRNERTEEIDRVRLL